MVNRVRQLIVTYPVTLWAGVGVFGYCWKASMIATMYTKFYNNYHLQRLQEEQNVKA
jgi:hypothetical protein